jgi:hypothetical protein
LEQRCRNAAMEISQLRSGWNDSAKIILSPALVTPKQREGGRDAGSSGFSIVPSGRMVAVRKHPGTLCRANFQLSLRDESF